MSNHAFDTRQELLNHWERLPVARQAARFHEIRQEAASGEENRILEMHRLLLTREIREEIAKLARAAGIPQTEMAKALDPACYASYFVRSPLCTMMRRVSMDYSRTSAVQEVDLRVDCRGRVVFHHQIVAGFYIHVRRGNVTAARDGASRTWKGQSLFEVSGGAPVTLTAEAGAEFSYSPHPLSAWFVTR